MYIDIYICIYIYVYYIGFPITACMWHVTCCMLFHNLYATHGFYTFFRISARPWVIFGNRPRPMIFFKYCSLPWAIFRNRHQDMIFFHYCARPSVIFRNRDQQMSFFQIWFLALGYISKQSQTNDGFSNNVSSHVLNCKTVTNKLYFLYCVQPPAIFSKPSPKLNFGLFYIQISLYFVDTYVYIYIYVYIHMYII